MLLEWFPRGSCYVQRWFGDDSGDVGLHLYESSRPETWLTVYRALQSVIEFGKIS